MHEEQDVIWHGRGLTRTAHGRSLSCWGERMGLRYNLNLRIFSSSSSLQYGDLLETHPQLWALREEKILICGNLGCVVHGLSDHHRTRSLPPTFFSPCRVQMMLEEWKARERNARYASGFAFCTIDACHITIDITGWRRCSRRA